MKKELVKLFCLAIFLSVWGIAVPHFFPVAHIMLTWAIIPLVVIVLIKFSTNVYLDILYSLWAIIINDRLVLEFADISKDATSRGILSLSFYLTTLIVFIIWSISLFTVIKKRKKITVKKMLYPYFAYLVLLAAACICFYTFVLYYPYI